MLSAQDLRCGDVLVFGAPPNLTAGARWRVTAVETDDDGAVVALRFSGPWTDGSCQVRRFERRARGHRLVASLNQILRVESDRGPRPGAV